MHKFSKFSLFSFVIVACLMVSVKLCTSTVYASAGDFAMYLGVSSTSGCSIGTVIDFDSWDDFRNGLPVGFEPCYDCFKSGTVSLSSPVYALSPSEGGYALCDISSFRLVSYNASYYVIAFTAVPDRSGALSRTYYLADNLGRLYAVDKSGKFTSYLYSINLNTDGIESYLDHIWQRAARTVDGVVYTIGDSTYLSYQRLKSIDANIADFEHYLDRISARCARVVNGTTYSVGDSAYFAWQVLKENINPKLLMTTSTGKQYTLAELSYNIWSRMNDVITAVNNQTVSFDASNIRLSVNADSINLWNNKSYCCGYRIDENGAEYDSLIIPFDSATDIIARLNTDYVGQSVTVLRRDGTTVVRYVRSATLLSDGAIRVSLTDGYTYYLCDNTNVLYKADLSGRTGSASDDDLFNSITSRLDTIIENQRNEIGLSGCDHQYVAEVSQEPTCALPGLMIYTCDLCDASYSEIMDSLGHDWLCEDHVEAVLDENGDIVQSGYDIYRCQICNRTYYDYDSTGAPDDESGITITDLISRVFSKLGSFVGGVVSSIINLLDKLLTGFDQIVTDFNDRTQQILDFGGDYPAWLGGVWEIIPQEMQLALGFCIVVMALGIIGKKVVFS